MSKLLLLLFLLLSFFSCGQLIILYEAADTQPTVKEKPPLEPVCLNKEYKYPIYFSPNEFTVPLTNLINKNKNLSTEEQMVIWTLIHMAYSPHLISPTSTIQLLISDKNTLHATIFKNDNDEKSHNSPLFSSLSSILKSGNSKQSLANLEKIAKKIIPAHLPIDASLEAFFSTQRALFASSTKLSNTIFKASQLIKRGETIPRPDLAGLLKEWRYKSTSTALELIEFSKNLEAPNIKCSFEKQDNNQYHINDQDTERLAIGLISENGKMIVLVSYRSLDNISLSKIDSSQAIFNFINDESLGPSPVCSILQKDSGTNLILLSTKGRSPEQHLDQFVSKLDKKQMILGDLFLTLQEPRRLTLTNPQRLLVEPQYPLLSFKPGDGAYYITPTLGNILIYGKSSIYEKQSLLEDPRNPIYSTCNPPIEPEKL